MAAVKLDFSKTFEKRYKSLNRNQQARVDRALVQFMQDKDVASLRYHALRGEWRDHYSISAGGDLRIHLRYLAVEDVLAVTLGTHSQLYK